MSTSLATTIILSSGTSSSHPTAIYTTSSTAAALLNGVKTRGNALAAAIAVSTFGMLIVGICIFTLFIAMRKHKEQTDASRMDLEVSLNSNTHGLDVNCPLANRERRDDYLRPA